MQLKIHQSYRNVVCICDSELLGKQFEEKEKILNVRESFYKGDEMDEQKLVKTIDDMAKEDATFNIVGEKSVNLAIKAGIISKEGVKSVSGIPFALVLM
ncbi:DUF424 family protein [Candidatus Pacearchaeota archaeon]|nr:DUF424 family protein [Candidatus Pacearchaeota archaeon]